MIIMMLSTLLNMSSVFTMEKEPSSQEFFNAIKKGEIAFVTMWAGKFANVKDDQGTTALMHAVDSVQPKIVKLLLEKGASVKEMNDNRITAVMIAALKGNGEIFDDVIKGSNINARTKEGVSALDFAILGGKKEIVNQLIEAGAQFDVKKDFKFLKQSESGDIDEAIIKLILEDSKEREDNLKFLNDELIQAARDKNGSLIDVLLSSDAIDINTTDENGNTALMILAGDKARRDDLVKKLLSYDYYYGPLADVTVIASLIDWFGSKQNVGKVRDLVNFPVKNKEKIQELKSIVFPDYENLAPKLYANVTRTFEPGSDNITKSKPVYEKLSKKGVAVPKHIIDFTLRNKAGKTAAQLAEEAGNQEIQQLIQTAAGRFPRTLQRADLI